MWSSNFGHLVWVGGLVAKTCEMTLCYMCVSVSEWGSEVKLQRHTHQQCSCMCALQLVGQLCAHMQRERSAAGCEAGGPPTLPPALPFRGASSITRLGSLWMRACSRQALFGYFCPRALQWNIEQKPPLKPALQNSHDRKHQAVYIRLSLFSCEK